MAELPTYIFKPHERPSMPGSPANPDHPPHRRIGYFAVGCLIGVTGGLGNALVSVNLDYAQGTLGLSSDQSAWLMAAYLMANVPANLLLVKCRQQFGLQLFIRYVLGVYVLITLMHLFVQTFWSAVAVRAVSGVAGAGLTSLTILYFMQAMPAPRRLAGVMIGIGVPQIASPLARVLSPTLLESGNWHMLYRFELGMALAALAAVLALPLPPSDRRRVFEPADLLTISLMSPGLWLLVAVLSEGRILWWTERSWLGWGLALSFTLIAAALILEHRRANPLLYTGWMASREIVRLMLVAASVRILLSEQVFGSVGLLTALGMLNDQMITLNLIIAGASLAGLATAVWSFRPRNLAWPIQIAVLLIAVGCFLDARATNQTRPADFYVSQALIGFSALLFLAQAQVIGIARTLLAGGERFISFVVLFGLSQNVGGLIGNALLGTLQTLREKFHSHELIQRILLTDPLVAHRFSTEGPSLLAREVAREANILAFNDVFLVVGLLALAVTVWEIWIRISIHQRGEVSPVIQLQHRLAEVAAKGEK